MRLIHLVTGMSLNFLRLLAIALVGILSAARDLVQVIDSGRSVLPLSFANRWNIAFCLTLGMFGVALSQQPAFMTNGLIAHYKFDGNYFDSSGNGNHGLSSGVLPVVPSRDRFGVDGAAFKFFLSEIYVPFKPIFNVTNITATAWVNTSRGGGSQVIVNRFENGQSNPPGQVWWWGIDDNSLKPVALVQGPVGGPFFSEQFPGVRGTPLTTNSWVFICFSFDGSLLKIYRNGVLESSRVTLVTLNTGGNSGLSIGVSDQWNGRFSYFDGSLDDIRLFNRTLSDGEVRALYDFESLTAHESPRTAKAITQIVNGFVVGATVTDAGSGYISVPIVSISGGGGSGATARATMVDGRIAAITIQNPGSGYTSAPVVMIAPPPFPPRKAVAVAQVVNGFVVGAAISDSGFGYQEPPAVLLTGGGGTGAKAVAIVANGVVTAIQITNPGTGYTSVPTVRVASPPFAPSLSVEVSQVKVRLQMGLGRRYQIESTADMVTWTPTGQPFVAEEEESVQEFPVSVTGQFFRIRQVP